MRWLGLKSVKETRAFGVETAANMPNRISDDKRYLEWIPKIMATTCSGFEIATL